LSELLDYAVSVLGEWVECQPYEPARRRRKMLARKREEKVVIYLDICGGCYRRFSSIKRAESAAALRDHVENDPCPHYAEVTLLR
jgi:hypothetical protein